MTPHTFKVEATHHFHAGRAYEVEKQKVGLSRRDAELTATKWAKAGYFTFVLDEATGERIAEAIPAEGD